MESNNDIVASSFKEYDMKLISPTSNNIVFSSNDDKRYEIVKYILSSIIKNNVVKEGDIVIICGEKSYSKRYMKDFPMAVIMSEVNSDMLRTLYLTKDERNNMYIVLHDIPTNYYNSGWNVVHSILTNGRHAKLGTIITQNKDTLTPALRTNIDNVFTYNMDKTLRENVYNYCNKAKYDIYESIINDFDNDDLVMVCEHYNRKKSINDVIMYIDSDNL
jgi:hypothetical protein